MKGTLLGELSVSCWWKHFGKGGCADKMGHFPPILVTVSITLEAAGVVTE